MTGNEHNTKRRRIIHIKSVSGYGKKGKREEEEKKARMSPFAGIIQIKFNRIISERQLR